MTDSTYTHYQNAAIAGTISDDLNPIFIFTGIATELLTKILSGEIDITGIAARELQNRGLDHQGEWVGFKAAAELNTQATGQEAGRKIRLLNLRLNNKK